MILHNVEQNTEEWLRVRLGKFTASTFFKLFSKKNTSSYNELINKVVFERITKEIPQEYSNEWVERGKILEPYAIESYEFMTFEKVERVGFYEMNEYVGCSPDGLIGKDGLVQVKCPKYTTLIDYLLNNEIPKEYQLQMQGEMMVTGRSWNDLFVFHPQFKPLVFRVYRSEEIINSIKKELDIAIEEAKNRYEKLNKYYITN